MCMLYITYCGLFIEFRLACLYLFSEATPVPGVYQNPEGTHNMKHSRIQGYFKSVSDPLMSSHEHPLVLTIALYSSVQQ